MSRDALIPTVDLPKTDPRHDFERDLLTQ